MGSAFHTLLLAKDPPDCLLLHNGGVLRHYVAQNRLLDTNGTFVRALAPIEIPERRRSRSLGGYRVLIPNALRALSEALLPSLPQDRRTATAMETSSTSRTRITGREDELDAAVAEVISNPSSSRARLTLGMLFAERELAECALEQFLIVSELSDGSCARQARATAERLRDR